MSTYHSLLKVFHLTDAYRIRITPSTDPDWDGTATDIHFFLLVYFYFEGAIFIINLCT